MSPPSVALFTLGAPRIERDGAPVHVDTRKAIALLAYLALTGQRHSRDSLASLLWPDEDQPHARGALRRTLSTLHRLLPPDWLEVTREAIGLSAASHLWLDTAEFESMLAQRTLHGHATVEVCPRCLQPLAQAAALYHDDFLAGFSLRECERFGEWQRWQRERLRRELAGVLEALARGHAARRAFASAIDYARRWLDLDPLHEPAHRLLMKLYFWDGERAAALRQYHICAQALSAELGVAPLEATVALYAQIKERRAPEPPEMTPVVAAVPATLPRAAEPRMLAMEDGPASSGSATTALPTSRVASGALPGPAAPAEVAQPMRLNRGSSRSNSSELPFVGRADELATLTRAYDELRVAWAQRADADTPVSGRLLAVTGEAGIGKTRLANEFLAYARSLGAATLVVHCYEGEAGLAYAPVMAVLRLAYAQNAANRANDRAQAGERADVAESWRSELARLLPEIAWDHASGDAADGVSVPRQAPIIPVNNSIEQARFYEGLREALVALCQPTGDAAHPTPMVVCFEDAHWSDSASLDWLMYVLRRLDNVPLCLLMTTRRPEAMQSAPLRRLPARQRFSTVGPVVHLDRLRREDMQALAGAGSARSGVFLAPSVMERLFEETEGTPFLLVEYLAALEQGTLKPNAPEWRLPGGARDVLRARLSALGETAWQLLTTAAVIGRSFDGEIARMVSGRGEDETVQALEELLAHGVIVERRADGDSDLYDFSHALLRELVYDETHQARRRLLHRRIAEAMAGRVASRGTAGATPVAGVVGVSVGARANASAGQIARHFQLAGQAELAADYYIQAARYARELYANLEALTHLRSALALGRESDPSLHEAIGDLLTIRGEYADALQRYGSAITLRRFAAPPSPTTATTIAGRAPGTAYDLARVERKLGGVYARRGEWVLAEERVRAALAALEVSASDDESGAPIGADADSSSATASLRASLYADWGLLAHRQGERARAHALALAALELAERADALLPTDASRQTERSADAAEYVDAQRAQAQAHNMLGMLASGDGAFDDADGHLARSLSLGARLGDTGMQAAALNNLAQVASARGDLPRALALTEQALALCAAQGDRHHEAALASNLADLLQAAGRSADALAYLKRAVLIYAEIGVEAGTAQLAIWRLSDW